MFSEISDDSTVFFQHLVEFPRMHTFSSEEPDYINLVRVESAQIMLYQLTELGINIEKHNISSLNDNNTETIILKNDIDRDGDDDIVVLRNFSKHATIDVIVNFSDKTYEHSIELSQNLTSLVKNKNLQYVGLLDLDSDSWSDIVFCDNDKKLFILKIR